MDKKKGVNFIFIIISFILGMRLFKDFDFETASFKKPALDIIFLITFIVSIYFIIKDYKKPIEK